MPAYLVEYYDRAGDFVAGVDQSATCPPLRGRIVRLFGVDYVVTGHEWRCRRNYTRVRVNLELYINSKHGVENRSGTGAAC